MPAHYKLGKHTGGGTILRQGNFLSTLAHGEEEKKKKEKNERPEEMGVGNKPWLKTPQEKKRVGEGWKEKGRWLR